MFVPCAAYYAATLLLEVGWLQASHHTLAIWLKKRVSELKQRRWTQQGYAPAHPDADVEAAEDEDEDVREERAALQTGGLAASLGYMLT